MKSALQHARRAVIAESAIRTSHTARRNADLPHGSLRFRPTSSQVTLACRPPYPPSGPAFDLSLPYRLRYVLAWDHDLCRAVVGVLLRAVFRVLRARARDGGVEDGRGGAVAVIQRFGGALNLNIHVHALVLDGVFARDGAGVAGVSPGAACHDAGRGGGAGHRGAADQRACSIGEGSGRARPRAPGPTRGRTRRRCWRGWRRRPCRGPWRSGASRGARLRRLGACGRGCRGARAGPLSRAVRTGSISTRASSCRPGSGSGSSASCRYALRPPVAQERLGVTDDGQVRLRAPAAVARWDDGRRVRPRRVSGAAGGARAAAAHQPDSVLRRAGRPGGLAGRGRSAHRRRRPVARPACPSRSPRREATVGSAAAPARGQRWADLMRRTFGFDVLACPRCGGRLRLIALIEEAAVIGRILRHLGLPTEPPVPRPARAPPLVDGLPGVTGAAPQLTC